MDEEGGLSRVAKMASLDQIKVEMGKCGAKPFVCRIRITVRRVLELLATHPDRATLLAEYSYLEPEDLEQVLQYAAAIVEDESLVIDCFA